MPVKKKKEVATVVEEKTTVVQEEQVVNPLSDYVQVHQQVMQDGKNYMLGVSKIDHHWYKQAELRRYQRDDRNNLPFTYEFDDPVLLTKADIKFLDSKSKK